ncbi:RNA exonuclease 5-like [Xyrichtys novacula]|uniref:RNA exonuclease 5-like n=1 Tax=Xyrichtys novacula TaxID=13765 RepID=A0AAV1EZP1_XYRNO|nr:RNA exonuclease 5-like [Xyrichtys novacula]
MEEKHECRVYRSTNIRSITINLKMASPAEAAAAMTCKGLKRLSIDPAEQEKAKRLKTAPPGEELLERGGSSRSLRISVLPDHLQQPITVNELTELLRYAALGKTGGIKQPSWCRLAHQRRIKALNVVIVEGLTQSHFYKHYLTLKHLRKNYTTRVTFTPTSNDVASEIFRSKIPESEGVNISKNYNENTGLHKALRSHPVITKFGTQRRGLTAYALSQEQMIKSHYPVKGMPGFEDFVNTDSVEYVTDSSPLFGLDCEMCLTVKGYELTRVSLVDHDGNCVLDELVKPQNRILNYLTKFSGITPGMLRPITTTLRDVQTKLRTLLPSDAVLVGHSLNNDLVALKMIHRHVIDTALLFRREFGQKFKLKVLAETVLKRQIQTEEKRGHNPVEDALAALELAQYFINAGPRQVVEVHLEDLWGYTIEEESADCAPPPPTPSLRFADILQTLGRSVVFMGKRSDVALDLSNQEWHNSDKEVLASFRRKTPHPFLSLLHFSSFSDHLKRSFPTQELQHQTVCANLREMCVVFAGPFPAGVSEGEVRRLFSCCGPVQEVKMLRTTFRVHAEVEFELLEGAVLAVKTLNNLNMQGQPIKVQRPVNESMLDLDLTLDALMDDSTSHIFAVKLKSSLAECVPAPAKVNGLTLDVEGSGLSPADVTDTFPPSKVNGKRLQPRNSKSKLSEDAIRETFSPFGAVESVLLPAKPGKHARHAYIKFESSEDKHAALRASDELLKKKHFLVCPSLTPAHLPSWVSMTTANADPDTEAADDKETHMHVSTQDRDVDLLMRKLDRSLKKLFRSLSEDTLSVVVLPGHSSTQGLQTGLCLMGVKEAS